MVRHARKGFTLVELLVVIAIISLLIAMLLPAIQAARESGRRAACASNLRQLATAVHVLHERHNLMPTYWGWFTGDGTYGKSAYGSWYVHLMPVMEQGPAHQVVWDTQATANGAEGSFSISYVFGRALIAMNPGAPGETCRRWVADPPVCDSGQYACKSTGGTNTTPHNGHTWDSPATQCGCWSGNDYQGGVSNPGAGHYEDIDCEEPEWKKVGIAADEANFPTNVLYCASDPGSPENTYRWHYETEYALTSYQANFNAFAPGKKYSSSMKPHGFGALSDGLSQTILFAETHRQCDRVGDRGVRIAVHADRMHHSFGVNWYQEANTLMFQDAPPAQRCDNWRAQANHGGALLVALADSSVRGISSQISRRELTNPNDPQFGGAPDYGWNNPLGNWDRLMLPDDGGGASFE